MIQQGEPIIVSQLWHEVDAYWAQFLNCSVSDLHCGENKVVYSDRSPGLFSLNVGISRVFSVKPGMSVPLHAEHLSAEEIYQAVAPLGPVEEIYELGILMYGARENFIPADEMDSEMIADAPEDERFCVFSEQVGWKGIYQPACRLENQAFGIFRDGRLVSAVTIKVWEGVIGAVRVATLPGYRQHGYARAVVSAAARWLLDNTCLIPQYDTEIHNTASQKLGLSIGFQPYGMISYGKLAVVDDRRINTGELAPGIGPEFRSN